MHQLTEDQIEIGRYYAKIILNRHTTDRAEDWERFACMSWLKETKGSKRPSRKVAQRFFDVYSGNFDFDGENDVVE